MTLLTTFFICLTFVLTFVLLIVLLAVFDVVDYLMDLVVNTFLGIKKYAIHLKRTLLHKELYYETRKELRAIEKAIDGDIFDCITHWLDSPIGMREFKGLTSELLIKYESKITALTEYRSMRKVIKVPKDERVEIRNIYNRSLFKFIKEFKKDYSKKMEQLQESNRKDIQERFPLF